MAVEGRVRRRSSSPARSPTRRPMGVRAIKRDEAVAMQDALIAACSDPGFQGRLRQALFKASGDLLSQTRVRHEFCLPVQTPVVKAFGFGSVAESIEAFTAELNADPEVAERRRVLDDLVGAGQEGSTESAHQLTMAMKVYAAVPSQQEGYAKQHYFKPPARAAAEEIVIRRDVGRARTLSPVGPKPTSAPRAHSRVRGRSASRARKNRGRAPELTRERAIAMQDALIEAFEKPEVQHRLMNALHATGSDPGAQSWVRQHICLPIQEPVVRKFGFKDVAESMLAFTPGLNSDPEVMARKSQLSKLVNPTRESLAVVSAEQLGDEPWHRATLGSMPGQHWRVVGGQRQGGIVPRRGKELSSNLLGTRTARALLSRGAIVQEMELIGDRLHYKKVRGEGPEYGWVSIWSRKGSQLLDRVTDTYRPTKMIVSLKSSPDGEVEVGTVDSGATVEVFRSDLISWGQLTPWSVWQLQQSGMVSAETGLQDAFLKIDSSVQRVEEESDEEDELALDDQLQLALAGSGA